MTSAQLLAASVETGDNAQVARLRSEARGARGIEDAVAVSEALELIEHAARQISTRALPAFALRIARISSWARGRLSREERRALKAALSREREGGA